MFQKFFYFIVVLTSFLSSCASGGKDERLELKHFFETSSYDEGLKHIEKSKFYQSNDEKLLTLMEKGMLLHAKGDWEQSSLVLDEARTLSNLLYTISLSKKAEMGVVNDNLDIYYGEVYERSLLYFYLSLNAILTYQKTNNREELFRARAEVLAWNSFLNSIKEDRLGKSVYKNDLLLKIYGAKIHEIVGTYSEQQIALNLYKEAREVIFKNYNTYPSFNHFYNNFKLNFEKLKDLPITVVRKKYISETEHQKNVQDYIDHSIFRLSNATKENVKDLEVAVTLIFEKGIIAEKVAVKSFYGLDFLAKEPLVALFVADVLGLMPSVNSYNPGGAFLAIGTASLAINSVGITFELPKILNINSPKKQTLIVSSLEGRVLLSKDIALINPLGDIAEEAIYEASAWTYTRVGIRLVTKHTSAILASFATYKALGGGGRNGADNFLARNAALLQYIGAAKLIEKSEKADTRNWSTLPNEIRLIDLNLLPGTYHLEMVINSTEKLNLGEIIVNPNHTTQLFEIRKN